MKIYKRFFLVFSAFLLLFMNIAIVPRVAMAQGDDDEESSTENKETEEGLQQRTKDQILNTPYYSISCGNTNSAGTSANIDVDKNFSLGTDEKERRVNLIKALVKDYGLTPEQAAGPVGNFMHESGGAHLPPDVNEGGTPGPPRFSGGYGWAQWTAGRQRSFIDFAVANGYMASASVNANDAANYAYLKKELNEGYTSTIEQLKQTNNPKDAAVSFEDTFERAGVPALEPRKNNAQQAFDEFKGGGDSGSSSSSGAKADCDGGGGAAIVGDNAFPLSPNKGVVKNPRMFANGTADQGGHPYIAYDILADPGTQVNAFLSGTVSQVSSDSCGGRLISIYNPESNATISYLHLSYDGHVPEGERITVGQDIAVIGTSAQGCSTPHLHIDAIEGEVRSGCSRANCPDSVKSLFIDIGPELFRTYQALPD